MLIYLFVFYIGTVLSLNIPKHNNRDSGSDSDGESSNRSDLSVEYVTVSSSNSISNISQNPLISDEEGSHSSSTDSVHESEDGTSSLFSSDTSGSYVNFSSFSIEDASVSSTSDRSIENLEDWSFDSLNQLLDGSDLSSLENDSSHIEDVAYEAKDENSVNHSEDQSRSNFTYSTFNFAVKLNQTKEIFSSKVNTSIENMLNVQDNKAFLKKRVLPENIILKPFYSKIIQNHDKKQTKKAISIVSPTDDDELLMEKKNVLGNQKPSTYRRRKRRNTVQVNQKSLSIELTSSPELQDELHESGRRAIHRLKNARELEDSNRTESKTDFNSKVNFERQPSQCPTNEELIKRLNQLDYELEQPVWHSYTFDTGTYNREELRIVEVLAEKSLVFEWPVVEWASSGGHAVGRGPHGLCLLSSHPEGMHVEHLGFDEQITSMSMFQWWNAEERVMNTGLITAQDTIINWHHLQGDNHLTQVWSWTLYDSIKHMSMYQLGGQWKIAITSDEGVVSIFGLELWKNWWFEQRWSGIGRPIIINDGKFIAVIQSDLETTAIFKYNPLTRLYSCFKNITSPGVLEVSAFTAGPHSFLAVGGNHSAIYQIKGDQFEEKLLQNYQLEHVELWLPIKLGYYRNDVMLLFQHRLDHHSHSSSILEALQWDGENFVLLEHSPCRSHNEEMYGFTCILDAEGEKGLRGATNLLTVHGEASILTASEEFAPIMFLIKTELVKMIDPVDQEVKGVLAVKQLLRDKFLAQQKVLEDAERALNRDFHKDINLLTADNWKIKELHAPAIRVNGNLKDFLRESKVVTIAGQKVNNFDFNIDMSPLFTEIKSNHLRIKALVRKIGKAVLKKEGLPTALQGVKIKGGITVNGNVKVNSAQINILNGMSVNHVFKDAVMKPKDRNIVIHGKKILENLRTNHLNVEIINGMDIVNPSKNVNPLLVTGDLEILGHLNVLRDIKLGGEGTLNGINLKEGIYTADQKSFKVGTNFYPLNFDSIKVHNKLIIDNKVNGYDFTVKGLTKVIEEKSYQATEQVMQNFNELNLMSLTVSNNLDFVNINGRPWNDFIDRVVRTNQNMNIEQLRVDGKISVDRSLTMKGLNSLQFPQDFFLTNEASASNISATKTFTGSVRVGAVDCDGTVNGILPQNIVTLSSPQNLENFTFYDLTVTERLDVKGEITGRDLDAFLSNPLLKDTTNIRSKVIFKNLIVEGDVIVQNKINDSNWDILKDVVIKTNQPLTINSLKTFEGNVFITNGLNVQSGFINNRRIKEFFTIDTEQDITTDELNGEIIFDNLQVGGLFDGVNISDLTDSTIKLTGDQTVMADLLFEEDFDNPDNVIIEDRAANVIARSLEVTETCNNWMVSDALYIENDNNIILNSPEFNRLYIDQLVIDGNLETSFSISGVNLDDFDKVRLSKTEFREITAPYEIGRARMQSLDFQYLNGQHKEDISTFVRKMDNIHAEIAAGNVNIRNLRVNGKLDVLRINGIDLRQLAEDAVWLKEDSYISKPITFIDNISMRELLLAGNVGNKHFENFIHDIVQKSDDSITFTGKKTYMNGLEVQGNVATDNINSIHVPNLLNINDKQTLEGTAYINGNVNIFENIQTYGMVNEISMEKLSKFVQYARNNEYHLEGDVSLADGTFIDNFIVNGLVNEHYNPENILNSVVHVHDDNNFENNIVFHGPVIIRNNLDISNVYNGVDVGDLIENIVFLNTDGVINSSLEFKKPLTVHGTLNILHNLQGNMIKNCNIEEWKRSAVFLDQWQKVSGRKHFHDLTIKNNINAEYINNYPTYELIKFGENINNKTVKFENVFVDSDLTVEGTINSVNLEAETRNRLMKNGEQVIDAPTYFHSNVYVTNNANLKTVNNKYFDVITVNSDASLLGNYIFHGNTTFENNLNISSLVNDIDLEMWMKNAVFTNSNGDRIITGKWNVSGDVYYKKGVSGSGEVNTPQVENIADVTRGEAVNDEALLAQYRNMCARLNNIVDMSNNQISLSKNFEETQSMDWTSSNKFNAHHFQHNEQTFIILSERGLCTSDLWNWNEDSGIFTKENQMETGCGASWHTVKQEADSTYIISLSLKSCKCIYVGMELWNFDGFTLQHINSFPSAEYAQALPNEEGTLYALDNDYLYKYKLVNTDENIQLIQQQAWPTAGSLLRFFPFVSNVLLLTDRRSIYRMSEPNEALSTQSDYKVSIEFAEDKLAWVDEVIDFTVGKRSKKLFAAVWSDLKDNATDGSITIYEDLFTAKVFQKLIAIKPSSLTIIKLPSYQTLLVYIENYQAVRIYSYHGFQGFKYVSSLNIQANKLEVFSPKKNQTPGFVSCIIISGDERSSLHCINTLGHRKRLNHILCNL